MTSKELKSFLEETRYCNFNHHKIKKTARRIAGFCNDKKKARNLFNWVKENIKFKFGYWGVKAPRVLEKKEGMCTNKANLLIAFLRAIRIPAGYGILRVDTKKFYRELMCPLFRKLVSLNTTHIYIGIFLKKRWTICDPSVDSELMRALRKKTPFAEMSGFNILEQEMRGIKGVLERKEFFANIDKDLDKPPKHAKEKTLKVLNYYLKFLREKKESIRNLSNKQIESLFLEWLSKQSVSFFNFLQKISKEL